MPVRLCVCPSVYLRVRLCVCLFVSENEAASHPTQVMSGDLSAECLQAAERAGDVVWSSGLLKKGPGLCHGVSGNGYALLALYRCTGDEVHLQRAQQVTVTLQTVPCPAAI